MLQHRLFNLTPNMLEVGHPKRSLGLILLSRLKTLERAARRNKTRIVDVSRVRKFVIHVHLRLIKLHSFFYSVQ